MISFPQTDYAVYRNTEPYSYGTVGFVQKQTETSITQNKLLPLDNFQNDFISHPEEYEGVLNWDSYYFARIILSTLQHDIPAPEILMEPDGLVAFEWYQSRDRQISVSIYPDGSLGYAGIKEFTFFKKLPAQNFPASLTGLIKEIMNVMTPTFRTA